MKMKTKRMISAMLALLTAAAFAGCAKEPVSPGISSDIPSKGSEQVSEKASEIPSDEPSPGISEFLSSEASSDSSEEGDDPVSETPNVGAWQIKNVTPGTLPDEAQTAFDQANRDGDSSALALACIGVQTVAGVNYAILVKDEDAGMLRVQKIYAPLEGDATLIDTVDFPYLTYTGRYDDWGREEDASSSSEPLDGGWVCPSGGSLDSMPQKMASAVSQALLPLDAWNFEPLCCAATQVVSGINYLMICRDNGVYAVTVYAPLKADATVTNIFPINVASLWPTEDIPAALPE